jgi:beta-glucosidase
MTAASAHAQTLPDYKNPDLPFEKRAAALVAQMTLDEKASQIPMLSPAIPRLGIPTVHWWSEAAHGVARAQTATVYPDPIMMAASWDPELLKKVAVATADEARAKYAAGRRFYGIILWSPTINMARDPRWGRVEETYGEDPWLTARLGVAFCQGVQGGDSKYLKTIATPKHFAMHSQETGRTSSSFKASERVLREYYLPAFDACFHEGGALSTMAAHNGINGKPAAVNSWLLNDVLRTEWGFTGAVVTDFRELEYLVNAHRVASNWSDAAALALNAGVDILSEDNNVPQSVKSAVNAGKLKMEVLDRAVERGLLIKLKLGLLDPRDKVPFATMPAGTVGFKDHIALARQMACEGTVLLKNDPAPRGTGMGKLLPLDLRRINSIAIFGPYANITQLGTYIAGGDTGDTSTSTTAGTVVPPNTAIDSALGDRIIVRKANYADVDACVRAAADSDVAIIVCGINNRIENEGVDRSTLDLPAEQRTLIERVSKINPATIVVLQGGSPIASAWAKDRVPAVVMMWYAGEQGGPALADILLGRVNPSGHLPITFYSSARDLPPLADYEISNGRTYMYCKKPTDFVFGHGLSYTTFKYENLRQVLLAGHSTQPGEQFFNFSIDITNTGNMDGDEVVQLYVSKPQSSVTPRPIRQLRDFARVSIPKGTTKNVLLKLAAKDLAYWNTEQHKFVVEPGTYHIEVGASSADIRQTADITVNQ